MYIFQICRLNIRKEMKNLKLLYRTKRTVKCNPVHLAVDNETLKFFVASKNTLEAYSLSCTEALFDIDLALPKYSCGKDVCIVGLEYMCGEEQLCVALQHGDIALCNTADQAYECVGTLDCNILSMIWSPDQEIVLLVTDRGSVVAMSHDFDPITELEIRSEDVAENGYVNVGWGSKETQFQGSAGKFVPGKKTDLGGTEFVVDDLKTRIAWRGDGQYFAVSSINQEQRKIRIWNREFELLYSNEKIVGLECSLAWKPSGALLASTQRKVHRHDVVFFELNGLQHGEFTLPFETKQVQVKKMQWNSDSAILLIWSEDLLATDKEYLQLWISTNYHWTLKQSLVFEQRVSYVSWDEEQPLTLHVLLADGHYCLYRWGYVVTCSSSSLTQLSSATQCVDSSYVAVIDGTLLKLTPFKYMAVPPPMCAYQFKFANIINSACFCISCAGTDHLGVLDNAGKFYTFSCNDTNGRLDVLTEMVCTGGDGFASTIAPLHPDSVYQIDNKNKELDWCTLRHNLWVDPDYLVCAVSTRDGSHDCLVLLKMESEKLIHKFSVDVRGYIVCLSHMYDHNDQLHVIVQDHHGMVFKCPLQEFNLQPFSSEEDTPVQFPTLCPVMSCCSFKSEVGTVERGILALSEQKQLFLNSSVISKECSSFAIHNDYILLTTTSHKLICISRKTSVSEIVKLSSKQIFPAGSFTAEIRRSVERGSVIVAVTPGSTKVVLQMPRGNLEEIHPRALVVSIVKNALNESLYKDAFMLMRKHRVNMNLLYDHNPEKFSKEILLFLQLLGSSECINLFLGDLSEEIVTETLYKQFYPAHAKGHVSLLKEKASKKDCVCDLILGGLAQLNDPKYMLSVLTAHVRKSTPDIAAALAEVKALKASCENQSSVSDALRYLHVMVDGRVLYKESLATYDLELALMVAQASSNDPKEYVPFLNELKELGENYMKYKIDMHLKHYSKAVFNIANCPEHFIECIDLVKSHNLYREALDAFTNSPRYREISKFYAEHLTSVQLYEEAGVILARCNLHKQAVKCFIASCHWQQALSCATTANYSAQDYRELVLTLANTLAEKNRHEEAATLFAQEAGDAEAAITILIKGRKWENALWYCRKSKRSDLIDIQLVPALKETHASLMSTVRSQRELLDRYYTRLLKVREIKKEQQMKLEAGESVFGDAYSDVASDFGSTTTGHTQSSGRSRSSARSAKSRRKQERNKYSLREGSRFEEEGLLQALHELFNHCCSYGSDVRSLVLHLTMFRMDELAKQLQLAYDSLTELLRKNLPKIWIVPDLAAPTMGPQSTVNSILASRAAGERDPVKLTDLQVFIPPKIDLKSKAGLHLHLER